MNTENKQIRDDVVPGLMHCAKCKFQLVRNNIYVQSGNIGPGTSETEPCPNGCGPLWPVTWKEDALDSRRILDEMFEENKKLKEQIATAGTQQGDNGIILVDPRCELQNEEIPIYGWESALFEEVIELVRNEHGANQCSIKGCSWLAEICDMARKWQDHELQRNSGSNNAVGVM